MADVFNNSFSLWAVLSDLLRHTFSPLLITVSVWLMTSAAFLSTEHDESYFLLLLPFCLSVCLWKKLSPWEMCFSDSCLQCIFTKPDFSFSSQGQFIGNTPVLPKIKAESQNSRLFILEFPAHLSCLDVQSHVFSHIHSIVKEQERWPAASNSHRMPSWRQKWKESWTWFSSKQVYNKLDKFLNSFQGTHKNKAGRKGSLTK